MSPRRPSPSSRLKQLLDDPAELHAAFNSYLDEVHTTLWGEAFDVSVPARREAAADWLHDILTELVKH